MNDRDNNSLGEKEIENREWLESLDFARRNQGPGPVIT